MKRNAWILLLITLLPVMAWGQNKISVKGIVYDNYNMTIPGASVVEKGTQNGTVTDMDGNFTIQVNAGSKIEVSFIGYKTMEVTATDKQISRNCFRTGCTTKLRKTRKCTYCCSTWRSFVKRKWKPSICY